MRYELPTFSFSLARFQAYKKVKDEMDTILTTAGWLIKGTTLYPYDSNWGLNKTIRISGGKKKMNIGYETKEFHKWLNKKFNWVDSSAKRLMFKAWCGRAKLQLSGTKKEAKK